MKSRYLYPQGKHKAYSERITDFKGLLKKNFPKALNASSVNSISMQLSFPRDVCLRVSRAMPKPSPPGFSLFC